MNRFAAQCTSLHLEIEVRFSVTAFSYRRQRSRVNKTLGMILLVLGLFGLAWGGFT